jgi:carbamate kinase
MQSRMEPSMDQYKRESSRGKTRREPRRPTAVVAVGGHAFMQKGEEGTVEQHWRNAGILCDQLMSLVERGYHLVITHGNGPQVGNLLLQQEVTPPHVPPMPLDVLVAQTEGSLGYVMQQALLNELRARHIGRYVVTVVTQVLVDPEDAAFRKPTKPIGPFLSKEEAEDRAGRLGWIIKEDAGRGWRRLVPSPRPVDIIQKSTIRDSAARGDIVLAGGGGGIPIIRDPQTRRYVGVEAVIDKDLTSSVLATLIHAELFVILTAVPQVYLGFRSPNQRALGALTLEEIEAFRAEGHFPAGSMGPKIDAIIDYLRGGGVRALVTNPDSLEDALHGRAGTHFVGRL